MHDHKDPPKGFPRMGIPALRVDSLAWYHPSTPGLDAMQYQARDEIVNLRHLDNHGMVGVPRTLAPDPTPETDFRSTGEFSFECAFKSDLRPEQVPFVNRAYAMMEDDLGGVGEAPTGFGKTTTGCFLISRVGRPTCIIIPKGDLDWTGELLAHTDLKPEDIDVWQGQKLPDPKAKVVVAMLQSVYRDGVYPQEVYNRFACLILDEVHRLGSPEFSAVMRKFPAMFRLGLSATADRRDGKMGLIHSHLGWRKVVGTSDAEQPNYFIIPSTWVEPVNSSTGKVAAYDPASTDHTKRSLMADSIRNATIAGAAYRAHKKGRRTIIFIEQIKHGQRIKAALLAAGVPSSKVVEYNGGTDADGKARAKACAPGVILIATYKFTAEGTNIPALDTAIFAHPIYDPRQAVGRILRKLPGKPTPIVLDVVDGGSPVLARIHAARWSYLQKQGARWKGVFS